MRPASPTGLYWSMDGEVACVHHAPQAEDPRWSIEGWAPIKVLSGHIQGALYQYQCQHCAADGRAVERDARLSDILERIQVRERKAVEYKRLANYHQQAADRLIDNVKRRQAAGDHPDFVERPKKKSA